MSLDLYYVSGSPYSWRVMLTAEVKGLAYQTHLLQLSKGDNRTPEYLKMNPRGRTPLLKDGDFVITESLAMMVYLDKLSGTNPLFGTDIRSTTRVFEALSQVIFDFEKAGLAFAEPVLFGSATAGSPEPMKKGAEKLKSELKLLEERLTHGPWLVGDTISAADIAAFPLIMFMQRAAGNEIARNLDLPFMPLEARLPRLAEWVKRVEALPGYERTYPPHWKDQPA